MKIGKLENNLNMQAQQPVNQAVTLEEVLAATIQANPSLVLNDLNQIDPDKLNELVASLSAKVDLDSNYNQVTDSKILNVGKNVYSKDELLAIRESNRNKIKDLTKTVEDLKSKLFKDIDNLDYYIEYDTDDNLTNAFLAKWLFPEDPIGKIKYANVFKLREYKKRFALIEADKKINKTNKKLNQPIVNLDSKYAEEINLAQNYQADFVTDLTMRFLWNPIRIDSATQLSIFFQSPFWKDSKNKAVTLKSLNTLLVEHINILEEEVGENEKNIDMDNFKPGVGKALLGQELLGIASALNFYSSAASGRDEATERMSSTRDTTRKIPVKVKGKVKFYDPFDVKDCYDCFLKGMWDPTFEFGLIDEVQLMNALEGITALIDKLKYALDAPYFLLQNFCPLMRLGQLCPIELAFLLSTIVGYIRFVWLNAFSGKYWGGFLFDLLIGGILFPLLSAIRPALSIGIKPMQIYANCTFKSIEKIQGNLLYDTYGYKQADVLAMVNGLVASSKSDTNTDQRGLAGIMGKEIINLASGNSVAQTFDVNEAAQKLKGSIAGENRFVNTITNPLFSNGVLDVLEAAKGLLNDFQEETFNDDLWLNFTIDGLAKKMELDSGNKIDLGLKILTLGTFYSFVYGLIASIKENNIEPCIDMKMPDGTVINGSPFTPEELANLISNEDLNIQVYRGEDNVPGEDNNYYGQDAEPPYLINPITDRRFNLTNCDNALSTIISKGDSVEFWKRIALGVSIDNV
jgi:hypothetical protein